MATPTPLESKPTSPLGGNGNTKAIWIGSRTGHAWPRGREHDSNLCRTRRDVGGQRHATGRIDFIPGLRFATAQARRRLLRAPTLLRRPAGLVNNRCNMSGVCGPLSEVLAVEQQIGVKARDASLSVGELAAWQLEARDSILFRIA